MEDGTYEEWLVPWDSNAKEGRGGPSGKPPIPLNACRLLAATDPSLGETVGGSQSAIIILAKAPTNQLFILEADKQYRLPDQIIKDMIVDMERYPGIEQWGVEAVQFQKFFKQVAATRSMEEGPKIPAVSISAHNNQKTLRIQSLQPELANDYILLNEDGQQDLKDEIARFKPMGREEGYDALDALEMARSLADDMMPREASSITQTQTYEFGREELWSAFGEEDEESIWDMADRMADENERLEKDRQEIKEGKKEGDKAKVYYPIYF
jgi:predicted phage terminase large subunit-like protein